jgi:hypothetical protein
LCNCATATELVAAKTREAYRNFEKTTFMSYKVLELSIKIQKWISVFKQESIKRTKLPTILCQKCSTRYIHCKISANKRYYLFNVFTYPIKNKNVEFGAIGVFKKVVKKKYVLESAKIQRLIR